MRIGLDLTALLPQPTGVDRYLVGLLSALAEIDRDNRYTIFVNRGDRRSARLPPNFALRTLSLRSRGARFAFQQVALPVAAAMCRLDVLHSPSFFLPIVRGRGRHLLTVHDMTSFSHPDLHVRLRRHPVYRAGIAASIRRADLVSVPSAFVASELRRTVPGLSANRVRIIPYGVGREFYARAATDVERVRERLRLPTRYVLFVGTIEPRKNLETLVAAYRLLVSEGYDEELVLAGRLGWGYSDLIAQLEAPALRGRVHLPGYVDAVDLPALYAGASAFVYASRAEGFGFPPLEAMATGVPVIASNTSSLAENLAGAAELVPVGRADILAAALRRVLRDTDVRDRLRASGHRRAADFSWERTARATLDCYRELGGTSPSLASRAR